MIRNRLHITLSTEGEGRGLQMICFIEKVIIPKGGGERFDDIVPRGDYRGKEGCKNVENFIT